MSDPLHTNILQAEADALATQIRSALAEVQHGVRELRQRVEFLGDDTSSYVRHQPIQALLIAAASGALLMGLASLLSRSHGRRA